MNLIRPTTANIANKRSEYAIERKSTRNARNRNLQTHFQATLIHPTEATTKSRDAIKGKLPEKQDPIKLCTKLTAKLLTTAYKSKFLKFKLDEDPLHRRIYFLPLWNHWR